MTNWNLQRVRKLERGPDGPPPSAPRLIVVLGGIAGLDPLHATLPGRPAVLHADPGEPRSLFINRALFWGAEHGSQFVVIEGAGQ